MAYLKGNSFVDGSLYVNDALYVTTLTSSQGKIPTIAKDNNDTQLIEANNILKYFGTNGSIVYSPIKEEYSISDTTDVISFSKDYLGNNISKVLLKVNNSDILKVDASTTTNISLLDKIVTRTISSSSVTIYGQSSTTDTLSVSVPKSLSIKGNSTTGTLTIASDSGNSKNKISMVSSTTSTITVKSNQIYLDATTLSSTTPTSISIGNTNSTVTVASNTVGITSKTSSSITAPTLSITSTTKVEVTTNAINIKTCTIDNLKIVNKELKLNDTTWKWSY